MDYNFNWIEKKWQKIWAETGAYKVSNHSDKPKYYVLDMFPYPSGAGLHVGHPLGYIASDIYARYKRLKGFNVLHPMGYDAFGLPAEQYAIEHGIHPAVSTENNINTFRKQLDNIGFCFDWSREVRTSDPKYYKWTQWIFLQLFKSWFNRKTQKAEPIEELIKVFEKEGNVNHPVPNASYKLPVGGYGLQVVGNRGPENGNTFTENDWSGFDEPTRQHILMEYRLAYCGYGEVNWCEALGTVLANDEVVNGVSERGGHPVVKKKLRQWYLRITEYADRLLKGLQEVDFSEAMKEMQTNWIGKSSGAEIRFQIKQLTERLTPNPSPPGDGGNEQPDNKLSGHYYKTAGYSWQTLKEYAKENRKNATEAEEALWQRLRNNQLDVKVRRQHTIGEYIVDFAILEANVAIEVDGGYHDSKHQQLFDEARTNYLEEFGIEVIRFTNEEVKDNINGVIETIKDKISERKENASSPLLRAEKGLGDEALRVYTTRPDTIFGVDFMVLAPELELVNQIKSPGQAAAVDEYVAWVKSRSERERMSEKKISGVFTGAYAINPFNGKEIPIWISEYVLAGYGTGAIMAVPCGDERDHKFAQHFNIPITNIIGNYYNGQEANPTKDAVLENSGFINGMVMRDAIEVVINELEKRGIGTRKTNYKMRDAAFSRQRYWGEPFPIIWQDGIAYPLDESELPLELPQVENYKPGPEGEGPLANIPEWTSPATPLPKAERGENPVPKYNVLTPKQYELARMMRKEYTEAEDKLWQLLRNNQLGVKFRRQHPIDAYIVDFICLPEKLIVEIDGGYHETQEQQYYDKNRTEVLNNIGFDVLRFTNDEVLNDVFAVKERIKEHLKLGVSDDGSPLQSWRGAGGEVVRETNTMPGYAGSSWYFLRYMDPHNDKEFAGRQATDYWNQVDLYIGGTEHAVGHLLYSRLWTKALYDLGHLSFDEPYRRLVNQGMIQGSSRFVYRISGTNKFVSHGQKNNYQTDAIHVDVNMVDGLELDIEAFKKWRNGEYANAEFILEDGSLYSPLSTGGEGPGVRYICGSEVEKMSKSKFNTVNPDDLVNKYGADTFRMYEMFLGPVEVSKPWDTKGIEGVHRFLKKLWRLFYNENGPVWDNSPLSTGGEGLGVRSELKALHKAIKKIEEDTERFSFNTAVSSFMILVNELTDLNCHKRSVLEPMLIMLTPYAPHIAEELWHALGNTTSVLDAPYPLFEEKYVKESSKEYPISINGKLRTTMNISLDATQEEVEKLALENEVVKKWLDGRPPKKIIYVKNKMVNVVV